MASPPLQSIQILRAVAALGVLIYHVSVALEGFGIKMSWPLVGAAGVDLFFVISGFVMVYASEDMFGRPASPRIFLSRRLARIVPLYWLLSATIMLYVVARYGSAGLLEQHPPAEIVSSFLFFPYVRPDGTVALVHGLGWTLNYEMFFYAAFTMAILLSRRAAVLAIVTVFGAGVLLQRVVSLPQPFAFWLDPIILEFCFGMAIAIALREGVRLPRFASWSIGVIAAAALMCTGIVTPALGARVVVWGLPSAALVAACVLSCEPARRGAIARGIAFLGDASYSLYLVHPFVLMGARQTVLRWVDPPPAVFAAGFFVAAIAAAISSYVFFEKPVNRALQRWLLGRSRNPSQLEPVLAKQR